MSEKKEFIESCMLRGMSLKKSKKAWESFDGLRKYIARSRYVNDVVCEMSYMSIKEKLQLRNKAAEAGIELTPSELDDLCDIVIHAMKTMYS